MINIDGSDSRSLFGSELYAILQNITLVLRKAISSSQFPKSPPFWFTTTMRRQQQSSCRSGMTRQQLVRVDLDGDGERRADQPGVEEVLVTKPPTTTAGTSPPQAAAEISIEFLPTGDQDVEDKDEQQLFPAIIVPPATMPPPSEVKEEKRYCIAPTVVSNKETAEQCGEVAKIAPPEENERACARVNKAVESGLKWERTSKAPESVTSDSIEKNDKANWKYRKKKKARPKNGSCFGKPKDRAKTSCVEDDKSKMAALMIADGDAATNRVAHSLAAFTAETQTTQTPVPINPEIHSMRANLSVGSNRQSEAEATSGFHLDHPTIEDCLR
ncbi:unnamed protein product [Linum trigynum]|uniref:Uncharacterized protein n=1 Tax=Linum trigynum TaxID=586398 RepID=A0AAV2EUV9_9ROSI